MAQKYNAFMENTPLNNNIHDIDHIPTLSGINIMDQPTNINKVKAKIGKRGKYFK